MSETPQDRYQQHGREPRNMGRMSEADGTGNVGSIVVGRALRFYVARDGDTIATAKFQVFNCPEQVAVASILTEILPGLSCETALAIDEAAICARLDGFDPAALPVVAWGLVAMRLALAAAFELDQSVPEDRPLEALLCRCHGVTVRAVEQAIADLEQPELDEVIEATGAGSACGSCRRDIAALLETAIAPAEPAPSRSTGAGRVGLLKRIASAAEAVQAAASEAGGSIELWNLEGVDVHVRVGGSLNDVANPQRAALIDRLERNLRDEVDPTLKVVPS
ncbi:MAG: iron-sulfur cluster assembly scaffold protein [Planctomycetota bacterium]|jgi:NifU-like protein involved in Fe-S cluster formation/bacterioferritin-associated ferredoxin|nr:iron-sulfur cluster assembly scaffold protein [Planctomycetota bacterium]